MPAEALRAPATAVAKTVTVRITFEHQARVERTLPLAPDTCELLPQVVSLLISAQSQSAAVLSGMRAGVPTPPKVRAAVVQARSPIEARPADEDQGLDVPAIELETSPHFDPVCARDEAAPGIEGGEVRYQLPREMV